MNIFHATEPMWKFWNHNSGLMGGLVAGTLVFAFVVFGGLFLLAR